MIHHPHPIGLSAATVALSPPPFSRSWRRFAPPSAQQCQFEACQRRCSKGLENGWLRMMSAVLDPCGFSRGWRNGRDQCVGEDMGLTSVGLRSGAGGRGYYGTVIRRVRVIAWRSPSRCVLGRNGTEQCTSGYPSSRQLYNNLFEIDSGDLSKATIQTHSKLTRCT